MAGSWCYVFEAKGIQRYILDSGRLLDMVGASDLVAWISRSDEDDLISDVLASARIGEIAFSRRSGGAFCMHSDHRADLDRFRALWRLAVGLVAPGMPFTDCDPVEAGTFQEALAKAYSSQSGVRENTAAFLPPTSGPMTQFNPRTGRAAVEEIQRGGNRSGNSVYLDSVTRAQANRARALAVLVQSGSTEDVLARAFLPEGADAKDYRFPRHFEPAEANKFNPAFPFGTSSALNKRKRDARIAVIHADISGLGQVYRTVAARSDSPDVLHIVAKGIEESIAAAARNASLNCLLPASAKPGDVGHGELFGTDAHTPPEVIVPPARPVVLGGDDITVIVRADLAVAFTAALLEGIEEETSKLFSTTGLDDAPCDVLTACAGVAIVSAGHPFLAAANMAEGMCRYAKRFAKAGNRKPFPSLMSFAVITSTIEEEFETDYRAREHQTSDGHFLSAGPYGVGRHAEGHTELERLMDLAEVLCEIPGLGKLFETLSLRHDGKVAARRAWERFLKVLPDSTGAVEALKAAFDSVGLPASCEGGWPEMDDALPVISDALELIDIGAAIDRGASRNEP